MTDYEPDEMFICNVDDCGQPVNLGMAPYCTSHGSEKYSAEDFEAPECAHPLCENEAATSVVGEDYCSWECQDEHLEIAAEMLASGDDPEDVARRIGRRKHRAQKWTPQAMQNKIDILRGEYQ